MALSEWTEFFGTVSLTRDLPDLQRQALAEVVTLCDLEAKAVLFQEGDPGDFCLFILEGEVGVYKRMLSSSLHRLATLGQGDPVGHLCLVDGFDRSATCVAQTPVRALRLECRDFDSLFNDGHSVAFHILEQITQDLCNKLRATNDRLYALHTRSASAIEELRQLALLTIKTCVSEPDDAGFEPFQEDA